MITLTVLIVFLIALAPTTAAVIYRAYKSDHTELGILSFFMCVVVVALIAAVINVAVALDNGRPITFD